MSFFKKYLYLCLKIIIMIKGLENNMDAENDDYHKRGNSMEYTSIHMAKI